MEKTTIFRDTKKHYEILDALRGIAAILVVVFHLFEIFSGGDHAKQIINHEAVSKVPPLSDSCLTNFVV